MRSRDAGGLPDGGNNEEMVVALLVCTCTWIQYSNVMNTGLTVWSSERRVLVARYVYMTLIGVGVL